MKIEISFRDRAPLICEGPLTARELLAQTDIPNKYTVVACRVNHVERPLSWKIVMDSVVEFVTTDSVEGIEVYIRTLSFLLTAAAARAFGMRLNLTQSMSYSYFFESPDGEITEEICKRLENEMHNMIAAAAPITRETFSIDVARAIMNHQRYNDKEPLLQFVGNDPVILYKCCGIYDFFGGALADNAAITPTFDLHSYAGGVFLSGPTLADPTKAIPFIESARLFHLISDHTKWLRRLNISTMAEIHELVTNGGARDLIMLCEAQHTKMLAGTAAKIEARPEVRLLCLAGPSSSGKTTSSRRLRVQLLSSGIRSRTLELDNYFVDRDKTPLGHDGRHDFEALEAIDLDLVNEQITALLEGKEVDVPKYDFVAGKRTKGYKMRLDPDEILVIEGIHGLNEKLTAGVPAEKKYKIFICPLTGANIDFHNRIGTTDMRLLRRLVRDARKRGNTAESTLLQWPSVVRGSHRHIFPYQECADTLFNTSLAYEAPVLKGYVLPLLQTVKEGSPVHGEASRLLSLLEFVPTIPSDDVPNLSILREFIGGSCFE